MESEQNSQPGILKWGIRRRVLLLAVAPVLLVTLLLGYYLTITRINDVKRFLVERGESLAIHLASASEFGLFSGNPKVLQPVIDTVLNAEDVISVSISNSTGDFVLYSANSEYETDPKTAQTSTLTFSAPVFQSGVKVVDLPDDSQFDDIDNLSTSAEILGHTTIELSQNSVIKRQQEIILNSLLLAGLALIFSITLAISIGRSVTQPILQLMIAVQRLRGGNLNTTINTTSGGELGLLESGIKAMASALKTTHKELEKQVGEATDELRTTVVELEKKNQELDKEKQNAIEANQAKAQFLANMSHEIRTPLNAVMGFARLLANTQKAEQQTEYIRIITIAASQLSIVIDDILHLSKLETEAVQLENIRFNLKDRLEDMISIHSSAAHKKGLELVLLIDANAPNYFNGDPTRINQILNNLVSNAIKFTPEGTVSVHVSLEEGDEGKDEKILIRVTDTGIGLTPDQQRELFTAFHQADTSISRRFGGTGLGLAIVKHLISLMQGTLGVESAIDKGSTFWFTLPCQPNRCSDEEKQTAFNNIAVLLYENHPLSRRALRNTFVHWGMEVYNTAQAQQIEPMVRTRNQESCSYDLVVLALTPAEADIAILPQHIGSIRDYYTGPLLILSGNDTLCTENIFTSDHNIVHSLKPIRRETLKSCIQNLLSLPSEREHTVSTTRRLSLDKHPLPSSTRVLVVEDVAINRALIRDMLTPMGMAIIEADCGEQGIKLAKEQPFDLALIDIHMPGMDGIETTKNIRAISEEHRNKPIIALTADVFAVKGKTIGDNGFNDVVFKPIDEERLKSVIFKWVDHTPESSQTTDKQQCEKRHVLLKKLLETLPEHCIELKKAYKKNDFKTLREQAHQVHGLVGYFGLSALNTTTDQLQRAVREQSLADTKTHIDTLDTIVRELSQKN